MSSRAMTRYDQSNICFKIDGYLIRGNKEEHFNNAKAELLEHMKTEMDFTREISYDQFMNMKKRGFKA